MTQIDINATLKALNKKFGEGSVQMLGEKYTDYSISSVSSGSLTLDLSLGGKGFPIGRTVELFGPESSGKTTIALFHLAEVQKSGRMIAFIDVEHALDPDLARAYGININNLVINQPDTAEEALDVCEALARTGLFGAIVIDSVSALVPEAEAEASMEQNSIGLQARLMSKALRKMTPACSIGNCTVIYINQIREKIGVMYGNPEVVSGGKALKFYSSIRVEVRPNGGVSSQIKDSSGSVIGHQIKCKVVKNKTSTPYKEAIFNLIYGVGIDRVDEIATLALAAGFIKQGGAWFSYKTEGQPNYFRAQGKDNMVAMLRENPSTLIEIESMIRGVIDVTPIEIIREIEE